MAAKDVDLATDYASRSVLLVDDDVASLAIDNLPPFTMPGQPPEVFLVEVGAGGGVTYRMRAHDTTLGRYVYWAAGEVDSAGAGYAGPGPLTDIVVQNVIGQG